MKLALWAFGFIKQSPNKVIAIDTRPLPINRPTPDFDKLIPDFLQDYPDVKEEIASHFPRAFGPVLDTSILVDSDHAHDKATRKSITGLLAYVGSTPMLWLSKRQGKHCALRQKAISLRYILRCLGCNFLPMDPVQLRFSAIISQLSRVLRTQRQTYQRSMLQSLFTLFVKLLQHVLLRHTG